MNKILFFPLEEILKPIQEEFTNLFYCAGGKPKPQAWWFSRPWLPASFPVTSCHVIPPSQVLRARSQGVLLLGWMPSMCVVRAVTTQRAGNTNRQKMRGKSKGIWGLQRLAKGPEMQPVTGCSENKLSCVLHPDRHFFQGSWLCFGGWM